MCWIQQLTLVSIIWSVVIKADHNDAPSSRNGSTTSVCPLNTFHADCNSTSVILINMARYGRMEVGDCVERNYGNVGCSADVLQQSDRFCSGKRNCTIQVPNSEFKKVSECPKDFTEYFETSYECISVETLPGQRCNSQRLMVPLSSPSGFLAMRTMLEERKGSAHCPWLIQASPGQRINISIWDFSVSNDMGYRSNEVTPTCRHAYATVREQSVEGGVVSVCRGSQRIRHVYLSQRNAVEVRMMEQQQKVRPDLFILQYSVVGCPDFTSPPNTELTRDSDNITIHCPSSDKFWRLYCDDTEWRGDVIGNCTGFNPRMGEVLWGNLFLPFEVSLVIVIAIAAGIGVVILAMGLIWLRRRKMGHYSKASEPPVPPPQDFREEAPPNTLKPRKSRGRPKPRGGQRQISRESGQILNQTPEFHNDIVVENEYAYIAEMVPSTPAGSSKPPEPPTSPRPKRPTGPAPPPPPHQRPVGPQAGPLPGQTQRPVTPQDVPGSPLHLPGSQPCGPPPSPLPRPGGPLPYPLQRAQGPQSGYPSPLQRPQGPQTGYPSPIQRPFGPNAVPSSPLHRPQGPQDAPCSPIHRLPGSHAAPSSPLTRPSGPSTGPPLPLQRPTGPSTGPPLPLQRPTGPPIFPALGDARTQHQSGQHPPNSKQEIHPPAPSTPPPPPPSPPNPPTVFMPPQMRSGRGGEDPRRRGPNKPPRLDLKTGPGPTKPPFQLKGKPKTEKTATVLTRERDYGACEHQPTRRQKQEAPVNEGSNGGSSGGGGRTYFELDPNVVPFDFSDRENKFNKIFLSQVPPIGYHNKTFAKHKKKSTANKSAIPPKKNGTV